MFTIANARNADKVLKCSWFIECFYDENLSDLDRVDANRALVVSPEELGKALIDQIRNVASDVEAYLINYTQESKYADDLAIAGQSIMDLAADLASVQCLDADVNIIFWGN